MKLSDIIPSLLATYEKVEPCQGDAYRVWKGGKVGIFVWPTGNSMAEKREVVPPQYDDVQSIPSNQGYYQVSLNGKVGVYAPHSGKVIVPIEYDSVEPLYQGGKWAVEHAGKFGVFQVTQGKLVVPLEHVSVDDVVNTMSYRDTGVRLG